MSEHRILPVALVREVDFYVDKELEDAINFTNSEPLDESGVWNLHALAARIYAVGFKDGEDAAYTRANAGRLHASARERLAAKRAVEDGGQQ